MFTTSDACKAVFANNPCAAVAYALVAVNAAVPSPGILAVDAGSPFVLYWIVPGVLPGEMNTVCTAESALPPCAAVAKLDAAAYAAELSPGTNTALWAVPFVVSINDPFSAPGESTAVCNDVSANVPCAAVANAFAFW